MILEPIVPRVSTTQGRERSLESDAAFDNRADGSRRSRLSQDDAGCRFRDVSRYRNRNPELGPA